MPHWEFEGSGCCIFPDSIRCEGKSGRYWGVIKVSQVRSKAQTTGEEEDHGRNVHREASVLRAVRAKKCGVEIGDPNLRSQPRLPGSVVGEASMEQVGKVNKITRVTVPW
jgi:hypothetical protein